MSQVCHERSDEQSEMTVCNLANYSHSSIELVQAIFFKTLQIVTRIYNRGLYILIRCLNLGCFQFTFDNIL